MLGECFGHRDVAAIQRAKTLQAVRAVHLGTDNGEGEPVVGPNIAISNGSVAEPEADGTIRIRFLDRAVAFDRRSVGACDGDGADNTLFSGFGRLWKNGEQAVTCELQNLATGTRYRRHQQVEDTVEQGDEIPGLHRLNKRCRFPDVRDHDCGHDIQRFTTR